MVEGNERLMVTKWVDGMESFADGRGRSPNAPTTTRASNPSRRSGVVFSWM